MLEGTHVEHVREASDSSLGAAAISVAAATGYPIDCACTLNEAAPLP
jgi:hypothetical protein